MQLDPTSIALINTGTVGANGPAPNAPDAGNAAVPAVNGVSAPGVTVAVSGDTYFDPSVSLDLTPQVTGGLGGQGTEGGGGWSYQSVDGFYPDGGEGLPGGSGGTGGDAEIDLDSDQFGSAAAPLGGASTIQVEATGGQGAYENSGYGGTGGNAGSSATYGDPPTLSYTAGAGGNGGQGGDGGSGGDAVSTIDGLTEVVDGVADINLSATGGTGVVAGAGGGGGDGFDVGIGGIGGAGGAGGSATTGVSGSTISSLVSISITLNSTAGDGGDGGQGSGSGSYVDSIYTSGEALLYTQDNVGPREPGGAGGAAGAAIVDFTGNTLTAPDVTLSSAPIAGVGGAGGPGVAGVVSTSVVNNGATEITNGTPASAAGANGALPADPVQITMTGNVISTSGTLTLALNTPAIDVPFNGSSGYNLTLSGNSFIGGGAATLNLVGSAPGMTVNDLTGEISLPGAAANTMSGFDAFYLAIGDQFDTPMGVQPVVVTLAPDPDTIVLTPGHASITIAGATTTNVILDFEGYGPALGGLSGLAGDTYDDGDGSTVINVPGDGSVTLKNIFFAPTALNTSIDIGTPLCFRAGTMIATPEGEVAVEDLREGDSVRNRLGDDIPVMWLGRRHIDCALHPRPEQVWPIRISAGAFGPDQPRHALYLSPNHAVYVLNVLIPIKHLVNGTTIARVPADDVTYYHVELPRHDVLLAEGLAAESYLDTGDRADFSNGGGIMRLFPNFATADAGHLREANGYAKLAVTGADLAAARRYVSAAALLAVPHVDGLYTVMAGLEPAINRHASVR
jgi:collagen type I alpha